jgi:general secretion pathway protein J
MTRRRGRGFTLLELLIAVAVFAVISAVAYGGLQAVLNTDGQTRLRGGILADLQVTLAVLERDLRQIVPVEPRDRFGDRQPALRYSPLATEPELELVRAGSGGVDRLRRVGWRVTEEGLERRLWDVVDAGDDREPIARVFLAAQATAAGTREPVLMDLRFVVPGPRGEEILDSWPPLRPTETARALPVLVEISLEVPGLGRVERHLALPGGP